MVDHPSPRIRDTFRLRQARTAWQEAHVPADNFRADKSHAPSYSLECDLEHQAGYLTHLLEAWEERNPEWDFQSRAEYELRDLGAFRAALRSLESQRLSHATTLANYMDLVEELLSAVVEAAQINAARHTR